MPKRRSSRIGGLFTAMITPFDAHGRVDSGRIADLVRFQISKGAEGLFPCGSTGLGPMLATEERKTVAEAVIGASSGRVPVVMQVGSADTPSTVALARHAEKAGADAVASLTPYYYHPGELAISKHFEAVSKSVGIPVFAYNIPQFTGNNLRPKSVAGLAKKGTVSGIKDSSRDFLQVLDILDAVSDEFVVMNGIEEYGLFALMSGADGLVSGGASALPELFGSMVSAHRKGDINAALSAQRAVQRVKSIVKSGPISAYYEILRARGMDCGRPRPPFLPLSKSAAAKAVRELRALHLF